MSTFRIKHESPNRWVVSQWKEERRWFLFKRGWWEFLGEFDIEAEAHEFVKEHAEFEPHTSYFDRHGHLCIEQTDW